MRVFIKYNPFMLKTEIYIEGEPTRSDSVFGAVKEKRLQEWVDELPEKLYDECAAKTFDIEFHGTTPDYDDVLAVVEDANKRGYSITLTHIPARDFDDKEQAIAEIFEKIKTGPFEELRQPDLINAFELARKSEFEVSVVATMSSGKSTLINAFLGQRLMPAKQEACTATITRIKDADMDHFIASAYDREGVLIKNVDPLTYDEMTKLNSDPSVSEIDAVGDIPVVPADRMALVLVDTPGPNNSRDPEHKATTMRMLNSSSKALVIYVMNATQLHTNDDNTLLDIVADSMRTGGRQSRDRFIFVVNKLDDFKKGEDSVEKALNNVRDYLRDKGIEDPNIFPASALTALNIRTVLASPAGFDEDDIDEAELKVKKFNRNEEMYFERYAPLPLSVRNDIGERLKKAAHNGETNAQALIHCGIVPIEEAIRLYVMKYAKTAKIKNIVDTFFNKLESAECFVKAQEAIASEEKKREAILGSISVIEAKLANGEESKAFRQKVDAIDFSSEINEDIAKVVQKAQKQVWKETSAAKSKKYEKREAEFIIRDFADLAEKLQAEVRVKLEEIIENGVKKSAVRQLDEYRNRLGSLAKEIGAGDLILDPFKLMQGELPSEAEMHSIIANASKTGRIKVGERERKNERKAWWKFWTWREPKYITESIYENREFVDGQKLAEAFFQPIEKQLYQCQADALEYANKETLRVKLEFSKLFDAVDANLCSKLEELKACTADKESIERALADSKEKLGWLKEIKSEVEGILEI